MSARAARRREPAIVAELGRPETPDETAARRAESSRRHRAAQTIPHLVGAIIVCLGIVLVMVLVVVRPGVPERAPVDVAAAAAGVPGEMGDAVVVPQLPDGWAANAATVRSGADGVRHWYAGYITPATAFASVTQAFDANPTWLVQQIRNAPATGEREIGGIRWTEHDQRGADDAGNLEYVLTTERGGEIVIVAGTADDAEMTTLAEAVSAALAGR